MSAVVLTSYAALHQMDRTQNGSETNSKKIQSVLRTFRILYTTFLIILMLIRQKNLYEGLARLSNFDRKKHVLGEKTSYFTHYVAIRITTLLVIAFQIFAPLYILYYLLGKSIAYTLCYVFSLGYHFILTLMPFIYLNYFCLIISKNLSFLTTFLATLKNDGSGKNYGKEPLEVILLASEMYEDNYYALKQINHIVSIPVLMSCVMDILEFIITLNLIYNKQASILDIVRMGFTTVQIICTLLPSMPIGIKVLFY